MYTVHACGWRVPGPHGKITTWATGEETNHVTIRLEAPWLDGPLHISYGIAGLEYYPEKVLTRAWGEYEGCLLGQAETLDFRPIPAWKWYIVPINLVWWWLGGSRRFRPRNCATVCQWIAEDMGLDWTPASLRWGLA